MFLLEGQKFTWDVTYKDDFHCGLIYEDKPVNNWAPHNSYEMTDVDGLYFEIAHDANPSGYRAKTKPLEVQFLVEKTGYARIACLVHEYETSSYLVFSGGAHTWSKDGVPCVGCEPGMFSVDGGACMACEGNTYQDLPNMPNCKFCPSGYTISGDPSSVPRPGQTELLPALIRSSVAECAPCPPGRYGLDEAGCEKCPKGRFRAEPGALSVDDCAVCDLGQYADGKGKNKCKKCRAGTYTVGTESTRQDMCLTCASGRYNGDTGLPQSECFACPEGFFQPHGSGGSGDFGIKW